MLNMLLVLFLCPFFSSSLAANAPGTIAKNTYSRRPGYRHGDRQNMPMVSAAAAAEDRQGREPVAQRLV
jgi:hypothetical protein